MAELLTTKLVAEVLEQIHSVIAKRGGFGDDPARFVERYHTALAGCSGDAVRYAGKRVIQEDEYFPKPARLRAFAMTYQRRTADGVVGRINDPDACRVCGARYQTVRLERVKVDAKGQAVRDARGEPVMETVERDRIEHDRRAHGLFVQRESA